MVFRVANKASKSAPGDLGKIKRTAYSMIKQCANYRSDQPHRLRQDLFRCSKNHRSGVECTCRPRCPSSCSIHLLPLVHRNTLSPDRATECVCGDLLSSCLFNHELVELRTYHQDDTPWQARPVQHFRCHMDTLLDHILTVHCDNGRFNDWICNG